MSTNGGRTSAGGVAGPTIRREIGPPDCPAASQDSTTRPSIATNEAIDP